MLTKQSLITQIFDFIENGKEEKDIFSSYIPSPFTVTIIKHLKTGKFIPKLTKLKHRLYMIRSYLRNKRLAEGEFTRTCEDDPRLSAFHCNVVSFEEGWDICSEICKEYKDSERIFEETNQNFFHRHLPDELIDILNGALAGDGFITQRGPSGYFKLALGYKQLGHLEDFTDAIRPFGFTGKIKKFEYKNPPTCNVDWSLWALLDLYFEWYGESKQKYLPVTLRNTSSFWRWFYAGDGCLYVYTNHAYRILIAANDFTTEDVDRLITMLAMVGVKAVRYLKRYTEKTGSPQWTIAINKKQDVNRFLDFIGSPIKSLEYKWERPKPTKVCLFCKEIFIQNRNNSRYCSPVCRKKDSNKRNYAKTKR